MRNNTIAADALVALLKREDNYLLTAHEMPEGDSIGSLFAMEYLLTSLGKQVTIVCQDPVPPQFDFLQKKWLCVHELPSGPLYSWAVVLDSPTLARIGTAAQYLHDMARVISIDHHISNNGFGAYNYVDAETTSCGEIVYDLIKRAGVALTSDSARLLYVALSTDSGSFRYEKVTARTHRLVAELIDVGFDLNKTNNAIYGQRSAGQIKLLSVLLQRLSFECNGQLVWSVLSKDDFVKMGAHKADSEGFTEVLRDIRGVEVAFIVYEGIREGIRISLRSKEYIDVNRIARMFNGGGHERAAGCTLGINRDEAIRQMITCIGKALESI